ncbi:store-operated calcium entry regulator STIMATE-like [Oscarella lobularis]|uniref:store-operated calcium entry regulator STIMATE-like n=1 Tax=Oscarella lobularis TaxID=121494 RepID=UPI0033137104
MNCSSPNSSRNASTCDEADDSCDLTDTFGVAMQAVLAVVAFSTLIFKRMCEPKLRRRYWRIWAADSAKQAFGALVLHFANIGFSKFNPHNQCTWYFINFILDSTLGLLIIFVFLKLAECVVKCGKWKALKSGEYGSPFHFSWWCGQCIVYLIVMASEKMLIICFMLIPFWDKVADFVLPIKDRKAKDAVVMLIVPFIVNIIMFWVVDSIIMRKNHKNRKPFKERVIYYKNTIDMSDSDEVSFDELLQDPAVEETFDIRQNKN